MLGKITKSVVDKLPNGVMLWDTSLKGFGVRRQTRDAFYLVRYSVFGRQRFITIGRHGTFTPDTAKREAQRLLGIVATGIDPAAERTKAKLEGKAKAAETFDAETSRYLDRKRLAMKPRSYEEIERHLRKHGEPLHALRLSEIDRRTVATRLSQIETASGPVARNRVRASLSTFFNWAVTEGLIEANPVTGTGKAPENGSRERVLTDIELKEVWNALQPGDFGDIVKLLILTGQRREEIGGLYWSEVREDCLILPPSRTKNRREHTVPLSPMAKSILDQRHRNGRDLVFGIGDGGFSGWSGCRETLPPLTKPWTLHDCRRTVATGMAELGIAPHIVEAVLNHVSGHKSGVAGVYNRAKYLPQMKESLDLWSTHITRLTDGNILGIES